MKFAVIGASGAIGQSFIELLESLPGCDPQALSLVTSNKSSGKSTSFKGQTLVYQDLDHFCFSGIDVAFFALSSHLAKTIIPLASRHCRLIIDNSSAFRQDPKVPLIIPEINFHHWVENPTSIIANPNCTTIGVLIAMANIHRTLGIQRMDVSTYQSISGAGQTATDKLTKQLCLAQNPLESLDLAPCIGDIQHNGYTCEELKMHHESKKILDADDLTVSAHCIRVPIHRGHSATVTFTVKKPSNLPSLIELLKSTEGLTYHHQDINTVTPKQVGSNQTQVHASRLRQDLTDPRKFHCWVVSDNLLRGGSYNAFKVFQSCINSPSFQTIPA